MSQFMDSAQKFNLEKLNFTKIKKLQRKKEFKKMKKLIIYI